MKLDAADLRYISSEEFRVLTAVEMGSKNHEVVPTSLVAQISGLRSGGVNKYLGSLAKRNLVSKVQNAKYDGYRLTYGGYDYLAMRALSKRSTIQSVGNQIGVGKESDIYVVADEEGRQMALKLHRLGRVSFRTIKTKRDYMGKRKSASWMYMSRLAAQKEWAFMKVLYEHGFPVPKPIDQARHCLVMQLLDAYPLRQISEMPSPGKLYSDLMDLIVRFAQAGLIHGDFNEFNILIHRETGEPIVIDFPQMVSTSHLNAEWYFNRDVECIRAFFRRRFRYESSLYPKFSRVMADFSENSDTFRLDVVVSASGFTKQDSDKLEKYMDKIRDTEEGADTAEVNFDEEIDEEEEEEEQEEQEDDDKPEYKMEAKIAEDGHQSSDNDEESGGDLDLSDDHGEESSLVMHQRRAIRSQCPSPTDSLIEHTAALALADEQDGSHLPADGEELERAVAKELSVKQTKQKKYHSKGASRRVGRPKGSKAKQGFRFKSGDNDGWN